MAISSESPITSTSLAPSSRAWRKPEQQRAVLGDVVGRRAEQLRVLAEHLAVGRAEHAGGRGGARVAAGAAVDVHDHLHRDGIMQSGWDAARACSGGVRERQQIAGDARAATVAHDAPLRHVRGAGVSATVAGAAIELATVDDHRARSSSSL